MGNSPVDCLFVDDLCGAVNNDVSPFDDKRIIRIGTYLDPTEVEAAAAFSVAPWSY